MTQSPLSPTLPPNQEFIQHYIDSLENLPLEIQRHVTNLREYDRLCRNKMEQVGRYLVLYRNSNTGPVKKKFLNKIQRCLIKAQQFGDDKLSIISQIVEMVEARTQQVSKDALRVDLENKEETIRTNNQIIPPNHRLKLDKGVKVPEKTQKNVYDKPKRQARRTRVPEKVSEKVEKNHTSVRHVQKEDAEDDDEEEDEEVEEEEETEVKAKKEVKRKDKIKEKEKEKEKEKIKEEKEERKEERKSHGKITKKSTPKHVSKIKKKKKKEKESTIEDVPVDPDEPTYCICNSISYGDMIGCDNDDCEIEWFHFCCVNLTHKPKGKWYCPRCSAERKEKGKK